MGIQSKKRIDRAPEAFRLEIRSGRILIGQRRCLGSPQAAAHGLNLRTLGVGNASVHLSTPPPYEARQSAYSAAATRRFDTCPVHPPRAGLLFAASAARCVQFHTFASEDRLAARAEQRPVGPELVALVQPLRYRRLHAPRQPALAAAGDALRRDENI
jgi:hypothetical protein